MIEPDLATHGIFEHRGSGAGHGEPDGCPLPRLDATPCLGVVQPEPAVVGRGLPRRMHVLAEAIELLWRLEGVVRETCGHQIGGDLAVAVESIGLPIRAVGPTDLDTLVPVDAEPAQPVDDVVQIVLLAALPIGVVGTLHEHSPGVSCPQPVVERGTHAADVEVTGR